MQGKEGQLGKDMELLFLFYLLGEESHFLVFAHCTVERNGPKVHKIFESLLHK